MFHLLKHLFNYSSIAIVNSLLNNNVYTNERTRFFVNVQKFLKNSSFLFNMHKIWDSKDDLEFF